MIRSTWMLALILTCDGDKTRLEVRNEGSHFPEDFNPEAAANTGLELVGSKGGHSVYKPC
jgi:hypothetical protein